MFSFSTIHQMFLNLNTTNEIYYYISFCLKWVGLTKNEDACIYILSLILSMIKYIFQYFWLSFENIEIVISFIRSIYYVIKKIFSIFSINIIDIKDLKLINLEEKKIDLSKQHYIMNYINKNYLLSPWKNFLHTNNVEIWLFKNTLNQIDNFNISNKLFNKILNNLLFIFESCIIFFEKIIYDILLNNTYIKFFFWYIYNNLLFYDHYRYNMWIKTDLYYSNIIELLFEIDNKYNIREILEKKIYIK